MEIKGIGRPCGPTSLTPAKESGKTPTFGEILKTRISQTSASSPAMLRESDPACVEQSLRVLDLLDDFAQALADPRRSLRDMMPLVRSVEGEVGRLDGASGEAGKEDRREAAFARDVSLLAHVTLMKFERGDFA